jgi:hypothetical protein
LRAHANLITISFKSKAIQVLKATRNHALNLSLFCLVYKATMLLLRTTSPTGKERHYDALIGGLVGGYTIFARDIRSSVAQQIVIYVAARVVLAVGKLAVQNGGMGILNGGREVGWGSKSQGWRKVAARNGWPAAATLSWGLVMYIFRWHPEAVQPSLRSSMSYMWVTPPESPLLLSLS